MKHITNLFPTANTRIVCTLKPESTSCFTGKVCKLSNPPTHEHSCFFHNAFTSFCIHKQLSYTYVCCVCLSVRDERGEKDMRRVLNEYPRLRRDIAIQIQKSEQNVKRNFNSLRKGNDRALNPRTINEFPTLIWLHLMLSAARHKFRSPHKM